ncbi:hypothetical protein [Oceanobacillus indicireducens]|uniref:Uncharacterized protein n=1 Tax=Oceanobacillus indicireducens TaxID=1004261 RepID=A0A918D1Y6_9BACI|nr:hypothetical protein [Oceanobacillus indicireducens]GGN57855.1 hypothetical protein GCM10007971_19270 [Oceanobacillus indicireducens]
MIKIMEIAELPFIEAFVIFRGKSLKLENVLIELSSMDYGVEMDGIIGYDLMKNLGLVIDLEQLNISIK